jgi:hypothetical protein
MSFQELDGNHIITNLILLESRAVKDRRHVSIWKYICPQNIHALSYEARVMNV